MNVDNPYDTREELINALMAAAELEHGLLCQYLYAAFSLKKHASELDNRLGDHIRAKQIERIRSWEATILEVAHQEMGHLGTVCNLLAAIGAAPQFQRPNFPQMSHYFPTPKSPSVGNTEVSLGEPPYRYELFSLDPFSEETLRRFIRFELPQRELVAQFGRPKPILYDKVGKLYRNIEEGIFSIDETTLFIGPQGPRQEWDWGRIVHVPAVYDRQSAKTAIDLIIVEGEGTPTGSATSHYEKFKRIKDELSEELQHMPTFAPARPVVSNPITMPEKESATHGAIIDDPIAKEVVELFNVVYGVMLLMLNRFYTYGDEKDDLRLGLGRMSKQLMSAVIRPLGDILTLLPAGGQHMGKTAGPSFEIYSDIRLPFSARNSWVILHERLVAAATDAKRASTQQDASPRLQLVFENLHVLTRRLEDNLKEL